VSNDVAGPTTFPTSSITINLGTSCPTANGASSVTWCTRANGARWDLYRIPAASPSCVGGVRKAGNLTITQVFQSYAPATATSRAKLGVRLPVDVPATAGGTYELKDDIVLRNTPRA
jgi:hypothetical protein